MKKLQLLVLLVLTSFFAFSQIPSGYYNSASGLSGNNLKTALHNIIKNHTVYPYSSSGTDVWDILKESDRDPNNSNKVILLYTGWSRSADLEYNGGSGWSREHCWPKSHGFPEEEQPAYTDCHHLRPADVSVNSARNSRWYGECNEQYYDNGGTVPTDSWTSSDNWVWKPRDEAKGDCARMIFYMATRYEGGYNSTAGVTEPDLEIVDFLPSNNNSSLPQMAKLSDLLAWSIQDPVDDFERNRNNVVYSYQGNRNPFIDHPEWVASIWGGDAQNDLLFTSTAITSANTDQTYNYNITYNDISDNETLTCTSKPAWLNFTKNENNNTAQLYGTPSISDLGNHFIELVLNEDDETQTQSFTIEVSESNGEINILFVDFTECPVNNWQTISISGNHDWQCNDGDYKINAYYSDEACNDWFISPSVNLDDYINKTLSFKTFHQYDDEGIENPEMKLKYSTNYSGAGSPENADWTEISYTYQTNGTPEFTNSGEIDLSSIDGENVYFAFHYMSSGTAGGSSSLWKIDNIVLKGELDNSQSDCVISEFPYFEDFEELNVKSSLSLNCWENRIEAGSKEWSASEYNDNKFATISAYNSGDDTNIAWLISPPFNFDIYDNENLNFETKVGYFKHAGLTLWISEDYNGNNFATANWTQLYATFADQPTNGYGTSWTHSGDVNLSSISGEAYIAFKYTGSDTNGETTTFQIDNVSLTSSSSTYISNYEERKINVYPNPSNEKFTIENISENANFSIIDIFGNIVYKGKISYNTSTFDLSNNAKGIYFIQISQNNKIQVLKIVLE